MTALWPAAGIHRRRGALFAWCPSMMLVLLLAGCGTLQLQRFQNHADAGDYAWIADQTVDCDDASAVCARRHLIRGEACFRLAVEGQRSTDDFACAADALEKGLALNARGEDPADDRRYHEILCEALRRLQERQSGETADATLQRFAAAAAALYRISPESIPAVYYLAETLLRRSEGALTGLNAATRVPVCSRLRRTITHVLSVKTSAEASPTVDWVRFADRYQRLVYDLGMALTAAGCR